MAETGLWKIKTNEHSLDLFALRDGFNNWLDLRDWFSERYGGFFEGVLIEW